MSKPEAMKQAQAELAAKREAEQKKLDEMRRDVPTGIEIEEALKKALICGVPLGLGIAVVYAVVRLLLNGGSFFGHLFSVYGILTLICVPVAWVAYYYDKEKKKGGK